METKTCTKCQEVKTLSEFGKKNGKILNICKKCICLSSKEWYENNKEKAKEWQENNKEKVKQYQKEWYENNKEKVKERRENNKEKIKQYQKQWNENNKEKVKYHNNKAIEDCYPSYITSNLKRQGFNKEQITPELIEEKTDIIKVKRIIKKINESIN